VILASAAARLTFSPFDFAGPTVALSLDDPVTQVPADFDDAGSLGRVGPEEWHRRQLCSWMQGVA